MKFSLSHLSVEITRRCNLDCPHCLRGKQRGVDINLKKLDKFVSNVSWIDSVFFTGGEPLLSLESFLGIKRIFEKRGTKFGNFALVTNGTMVSNGTLNILNDFFSMSMYDGSYIHVSKDSYHKWDQNREKNFEILKSGLKDVSIDSGDNPKILKIGKSVDSGNTEPDRWEYPFELLTPSDNVVDIEPKCHHILGDLFFSVNGGIHRDWELSYDEMDAGVGLIYQIRGAFKVKDFMNAIRGIKNGKSS